MSDPRGSTSPPVAGGLPPALVRRRLAVLAVLVAAGLLTLGGGLAYWQIGRAEETQTLERRQSLRRIMLPAPRGAILDREQRVLAGTRERVAAVLHLARLQAEWVEGAPGERGAASGDVWLRLVEEQAVRVGQALGREVAVEAAGLAAHLAQHRHKPLVLVPDLAAAEAARLAATLESGGPLQLERVVERVYPQTRTAAQVLGRVRRELVRTPIGAEFPIFNYTTLVGDGGLEQQFEAQLQGRPGERVQRVDVFGLPVGPVFESVEAVAGEDLRLSLDLVVQQAAERAMAATPGTPRGAAVALAVQTGEVLAMVSKPDFDLGLVSPVLSHAMKAQIDQEGGWFNRATHGVYPPGSSFKVYTMLAALRRGTLTLDQTADCDGQFEHGGRGFQCHRPEGHGRLRLRTALAPSCNVFAYQAGLAAGAEALAAEARRFRFHEPTGIELPGETERMTVPAPAAPGDAWTVGDTLNLAIGQGALQSSPLQAACAIASLARRETVTVPTLLYRPARRASGDRPPEPLGLSEEAYQELIRAMQAVVETGIGKDAQVPGVTIAGKTGTAQIQRAAGMMNVAWYVAFAPVERPEIAVAVAMEGEQPGVEFAGAEHAAPIVREILGSYFDRRRSR